MQPVHKRLVTQLPRGDPQLARNSSKYEDAHQQYHIRAGNWMDIDGEVVS